MANQGIIYVCETCVPGLVKIGKCGSDNFESRMYNLEHNGYRNVTALQRSFAIELDEYSEKEELLHTIFEKSRIGDTELFAIDKNIAIQLLSSFEGKVFYPKDQDKDAVFSSATDNKDSRLIPDGLYTLSKKKKSDNKTVNAKVKIEHGKWILQQGSVLGVHEDTGIYKGAKATRATLPLDANGTLLNDVNLGECSPSFVGTIVMNQANNGWFDWKNEKGESVDIYRQTQKTTVDD